MKKWLLLASAMCLFIVLAACGANNNGGNNSGAAAADSEATSEIVITASNWKFDQEEYKIKAGETVSIKLDSIEGMHSAKIQKTKYDIKKGNPVAVKFDKPGTYDIICNVPCGQGHTTMVSKLVVE
ncbi:hypothetical protein D3C78_754180 [compost metagenome]